MTHRTTFGALVLAMGVGACGLPGTATPVDVGAAPAVAQEVEVGREIGLLLSADEEASRQAEARLSTVTGEDRVALLAYRDVIPNERDPRWLNVLDEHHALPELGDRALVDFLVWKGERPGSTFAMKAQNQLLDLARQRPDMLIARLREGGEGMEKIAVALSMAGVVSAVPVLLERYTDPRDAVERRAAADALARIAGDGLRPRARGSARELAQDASSIRAWYDEQQELAADRQRLAAERTGDG